MPDTVITRFAPSPTGFLHIGGARTALFNWSYARRHGGRFLLRIEDTDRARSTDAAIAAILDGLRWLGLDWDGDPLMQFARSARHAEIAHDLLARGHAYRCYATAAELEAMREAARLAGRAPGYDGRWRDQPPGSQQAGQPFAVRFKAPREGETIIEDAVQGRVVFANRDLDDLVILRSDGTPTYNLAVVVDDHDMGVTHVIRGDDHLTNAARQTQIYRAMDWPVPTFAHVPLIHGPDGAKLSKRHGALGVDAYRAMGYTPAALRNYLARLGWGHGNDELFSTEQFTAWFDLAGVVRSPARFDFTKLDSVSAHHIRTMPDDALMLALRDLAPHLPAPTALPTREAEWQRLAALLPAIRERAKTLVDIFDQASVLWQRQPAQPDAKAAALLTDTARTRLARLAPRLAALGEWTAPAIESEARAVASDAALKLGDLAQPLRAALTGRAVSPPIFEVAAVLGRDEALARLATFVP